MSYRNNRILIIDDEVEIAQIIQSALERDGFTNITICHTASDGINNCRLLKPNIILLDVLLPDGSGTEIFNTLKGISDVPILFISAKTDEVDRLLGFALGADDYITKPFSPKEVAYRVKARLKNSRINMDYISFGDITVDRRSCEVRRKGEIQTLTAKEYKLLLYFIDNPNTLIDKEILSKSVWGEDYICSDNTISVHIRKLRMKIERDPSHPIYIKTEIGLGYRFTPGFTSEK